MLLPPGRGKKPQLDLLDLPRYTREVLGLSGVNLTTDLLAGADRARLEGVRERADRAGCACLLLFEPEVQNFGSSNQTTLANAANRTRKVVEAAQILGCSAAAVKVQAPDSDDTLKSVADALKPIVARAEKLDINLLISPVEGAAGKPDRVTELLKKVGGFRIGTYPDFETASKSADAVQYLHRLTPYATAVCAATIALTGPDEDPKPPPRAKKSKAARSPVVDEVELETPGAKKVKKGKGAKEASGAAPAPEPAPAKGGKKGKAAAPATEPEPVLDDEADLTDEESDELEALIEEALSEDVKPAFVAYRHEPYDLRVMVDAVAAVGYDGPLVLDYRGTSDPVSSLIQTRDTLLAIIEAIRAGE